MSVPVENQAREILEGETTATTEVSHEAALFAEPLFQIGEFTVTNSLLNSWLAVAIIIAVSLFLRRRAQRVPGVAQGVAEVVIDGALKLADSVTNNRVITKKIFPAAFAIFIFVLISNWL